MKVPVFLLHYLYHLTFGLHTSAAGSHDHTHLVAVESVHGVALGHEEGLTVGLSHH